MTNSQWKYNIVRCYWSADRKSMVVCLGRRIKDAGDWIPVNMIALISRHVYIYKASVKFTEQWLGIVTFVWCNSDVCLYISVSRQHVSIGAALGLGRKSSGQHVCSGGRLLRWCRLAPLESAVDRSRAQKRAPHHPPQEVPQPERRPPCSFQSNHVRDLKDNIQF